MSSLDKNLDNSYDTDHIKCTNYMIIYLILIFVIIILSIRLYKRTLYSKRLFERTWLLEVKLMDIYDRCPPDVQFEIGKTLDNITPL